MTGQKGLRRERRVNGQTVVNQPVGCFGRINKGRVVTDAAEGPMVKACGVTLLKGKGGWSVTDTRLPIQEKMSTSTTSPMAHAKVLGVTPGLTRPTDKMGSFPLWGNVVAPWMGRRKDPRSSGPDCTSMRRGGGEHGAWGRKDLEGGGHFFDQKKCDSLCDSSFKRESKDWGLDS